MPATSGTARSKAACTRAMTSCAARESPYAPQQVVPTDRERDESGADVKRSEPGQLQVEECARGRAVGGQQREHRTGLSRAEVAALPVRKITVSVGEQQAGPPTAGATGVVVDRDGITERDIVGGRLRHRAIVGADTRRRLSSGTCARSRDVLETATGGGQWLWVPERDSSVGRTNRSASSPVASE